MLQFIGDNKKMLHTHENKFAELEAFKSNTKMFQSNTNASLKNLESQVGKLTLTLQNQNQNAFPSDTQKNPKDRMEVQLRSGKEVRSSSRVENKEKADQEKDKATGREDEKSMSKRTTKEEK